MRSLKLSARVGFQQFGLAKPGTVLESPAHLLRVCIFVASSCQLQTAHLLVAQVFNASQLVSELNQCMTSFPSLWSEPGPKELGGP